MRRRTSIIHDAYHEAGHAVVGLVLGLPVSSVWLVEEGRTPKGGLSGRTQFVGWGFSPLPEHEKMIANLAGDIAGGRYRGLEPWNGRGDENHVLDAMDRLGPGSLTEGTGPLSLLMAEATALVEEHWADIERLAVVLAREHELYNLAPETWRAAIGAP